MTSIIILGLSIILQFTAAALALRLMRITGRWWAWGLIAIAMTLMGVRRSITFYNVVFSDVPATANLTAELVALSISVLMVLGVYYIGPVFQNMQQTQESLRESETRYRNLFDNADISIWNEDFSELVQALNRLRKEGVHNLRQYFRENEQAVWDLIPLVKVIHVNRTTLKLFGAETEAEFLNSIGNTFAPDTIDVFTDEICAIWDKKKFFRSEAKFRTFAGEELIVMISMPIPETEEGYSSIPVSILDITERKALDASLRRSQKMESIGQLTGGIAHDFNNILGIIYGNLEMLREMAVNDGAARDMIEGAFKGAQRGAEITKKLLGFSRRNSFVTRVMSVNESIRNMEDLISKSLTALIKVESRLADDLWDVDIDPGDLEDAVLNLSLNARDAMPDGGTLIIETANRFFDETYVRHDPSAQVGEFVMVSVSDTGAGMSEEVKEKIFEPFFSTKGEGKGTGLGLSMVYGFVKRSGGHFKVYSEAGEGTTIRFYLPRARAEAVEETGTTEGRDTLTGGSETILAVDDEEMLATIAMSQLKSLGYTVLTANSGREALEVLETHPEVSLLFSDVIMPGDLDGYQLALAALRMRPSLKVLLTSGFTNKREEFVTADSGFSARLAKNFLSKPYTRPDLAKAVRGALDEGEDDFFRD